MGTTLDTNLKIGIISRCENKGLGIQSKEFFDNIPCKALVIEGLSNLKQNYNWFPNQQILRINRVGAGCIPRGVIEDFLRNLDVVVAFETPYDYNIFTIAKQKGIKTVLQLNYEFLEFPNHSYTSPDLFAAPSVWHYEDIPEPKIFLPVPVNTKYFTPIRKEKTFIHVTGQNAIHDRNGTEVFLRSLQYVKNSIHVIVRAQGRINIPPIPRHISLTADFDNKENYYDNFKEGGVFVMPRKFGGLSLPCNEAIAAEMPVIMTDISPNNYWLPKEWLVPAHKSMSFRCRKQVDVYEASSHALAAKIDEFCEPQFLDGAIENAQKIKETISWETLRPKYYEVFNSLIK